MVVCESNWWCESNQGVEFFESKLSELCTSWLGDSVFSIREAAALNLSRLTEVFGAAWSIEHLIPRISQVAAHPNYLFRITAIYAVRVRFHTLIMTLF
jgi:serine/threonine-protein phosphatase 2A regulatory subunit A